MFNIHSYEEKKLVWDDHKRLFYNWFAIRYEEQPEPEAKEEEVESETEKDDDKMRGEKDDDKMRGNKSGQIKQTPLFVFVLMAGALVILLA